VSKFIHILITSITIVFVTACGGGGGGGDSTSTPNPTPAPTPAPTYEYPASFYFADNITNFVACIDYNRDRGCDTSEIYTTNYTSDGNNQYSFTLSTQSASEKNNIDAYARPYVVWLNYGSTAPIVLEHPGKTYLESIGVDSAVKINAFTTTFVTDWTYNVFPEFYYTSNFASVASQNLDNNNTFYWDLELQRLSDLEGISPDEFFNGLSTTSNLNSGRNNIMMDKLIKSSQEIDTTITNDILTAINNTFEYFYIPTNGASPEFINITTGPSSNNLRTFAYTNYPNDSTGSWSGLTTFNNFSTPVFTYGHLGTQNFVGNWDANYIFANGSRVVVDNGTTYLSKYIGDGYTPDCDIDPGFSCKLNISLANWVAETSYYDEYYRLDSINGNTIDTYLDIYYFDRELPSGSIFDTYCSNREAAMRSKEENGFIKYAVLQRYMYSDFDGSTCTGTGYQEEWSVYGYDINQAGASSMFFYSSNPESYFAPIRYIYPLSVISESNLQANSTIDSNYSYYIDNHSNEPSLSNIESTIIRILGEGSYMAYARFAYFEDPLKKRNYLFIFKPSGETSIYSIQCSVDGLMIVDYYFPDDTQIATAINTCLPYLQPGYQSPDPYNRVDSSPYIKAENSSFSFNEYDLLRETERMHQEVMQKYGLIEEPIIEQDKQIPLKKKSKYLKPISD
tara:strand:+ start:110 stop:2146 length:2037 start_codon:yes stop_codon:yes gene_type:complete